MRFKKPLAAFVSLSIVIFFIQLLPVKNYVQFFSSAAGYENSSDIYYSMVRNAIPLLDIYTNDGESEKSLLSTVYSIFKHITKMDIDNLGNPKTYLTSEIPLLGLFDVKSFNGNLKSASSSLSGSENTGGNDNTSGDSGSNFNDIPVVNPQLDYSKPSVIIFHTHTSESYTPTDKYNYKIIGDYTTQDDNFNVCRVGEEIKNYLETYYGVTVIHDTAVHDIPSRNGSYTKSKATMEKLLKSYPNVQFLIDLHRDAADDKKKVTANIRGEQAAKIMFCIGKSNPHWQENYYLSSKLNQKVEELYPGITRTVYFGPNLIYNQDLSNKAILVEIGAQRNTLEEALVSGRMLAKAVGEVLKQN